MYLRANRELTSDRVSLGGLALFAAGLLAVPGTVHAQGQTREELDIGRIADIPPAEASRLTVDGDIERGPCPLADPAYADIKVTFSAVDFGALTAVSADELRPAWQALAGRELPIASLCDVRDRAATILRSKGFLAAVQVPPQRIDPNGVVHMDVLVARLVEVQIRGDAGNSERLIAAHMAKLTEQPFLNLQQAERHLLLAQDLPGFDVRLTLRPADGAPGDVVGDVTVSRRRVSLDVAVQNLGARQTGRVGGFAQLIVNDLTGLGDKTRISFFNTADLKEQSVFQLAHNYEIGANGLRLEASYVFGRARPGIANGAFTTRTRISKVDLNYPFVRRQEASLRGSFGMEAVNQAVDFSDVALSRDRLRVAFAKLELEMVDKDSMQGKRGYSTREPRWQLGGALEARQGLDMLGASRDCAPLSDCLAPNIPISNIGADPSGFSVRFEGSAEFRPTPDWTIAFAPLVQYSPDSLLAYEQVGLGNYTIGRGFDPGTLQGDSGAGGSLELRYGSLVLDRPDALKIQPYVFLDKGWVWLNDGGLTNDPLTLTSLGGGLRARWGSKTNLDLTLAIPVERSGFAGDPGDVRLLFTLTSRILP